MLGPHLLKIYFGLGWPSSVLEIVSSQRLNWIQGGGNRVSVHFAVAFLDCWRTSFCVTTIIKIVNNNTNDKQTFGASLALDEDSPLSLPPCIQFSLVQIKENSIQISLVHILWKLVLEDNRGVYRILYRGDLKLFFQGVGVGAQNLLGSETPQDFNYPGLTAE